MTEERVAVVIANCARAMVLAMGMQAENQARIAAGLAIAYPEKAFLNVLMDNDIGHDSVIIALRT